MIMKKLFAATAISAFLCTSVAQAQQATFPTTSGASIATPVSVPNGGSGNSSLAVGALNTGNGTGAYVPLADVATGSCLTSGGVGIMPGWGSCSSGGGGVPANLTLANPASAITESFPTTSFTAARTDAAQTFSGIQSFSSNITTAASLISTATGTALTIGAVIVISGTKPSVTTGGGAGTTPVVTGNTSASFSFVVGSSPTSGTFTLNFFASNHFYNCRLDDQTTPSNSIGQVAGGSSTTAVFQSFSRTTGAAQALTAGDVISGACLGG
jgi:hypothetical protein